VRTFSSLAEFAAARGEHLGYSPWHLVTQDQIDRFADATGDHQWIHVDQQRAAQGPFGTTIAHGYLTLALMPVLTSQICRIGNLTMAVNYGLDRVRFPGPVLAGSRVRAGSVLTDVRDTQLGKLCRARVIIEVEGRKRAACRADTLSLYVP